MATSLLSLTMPRMITRASALLAPLVGVGLATSCISWPGEHEALPRSPADPNAPHTDTDPPRSPADDEREAARPLVESGARARDAGDMSAAARDLERALVLDPTSAVANLEWALTAEANGMDPSHIQLHYLAAARLAPADARIVRLTAAWLERQSDLDGALLYYERAATLDPADAEARTRRGDVLLRVGRPADAQQVYLRALEVAPEHLPALLGLATAAEQTRQLDISERALRQVVALQPEFPLHRSRLIAFLKRTGQHGKALAEGRALEKEQPRDPRKLRALPGAGAGPARDGKERAR